MLRAHNTVIISILCSRENEKIELCIDTYVLYLCWGSSLVSVMNTESVHNVCQFKHDFVRQIVQFQMMSKGFDIAVNIGRKRT